MSPGAPALVDRAAIVERLLDWRDGRASAAQLRAWAESVRAAEEAGPAAREALADLDLLEVHLLTPDDVPALLALVATEDAAAGIEAWTRHRGAIDLDARSKRLKKDPFYRAFCR